MSKILTETGHLVMMMAAVMKTRLLLKASSMAHLTPCKMTKRCIELQTGKHSYSPRIYQEITKMGCTGGGIYIYISPVFQFFLCIHNYHSWDSPSFVGFKEHGAHILQDSPLDAKCAGLFRVVKI